MNRTGTALEPLKIRFRFGSYEPEPSNRRFRPETGSARGQVYNRYARHRLVVILLIIGMVNLPNPFEQTSYNRNNTHKIRKLKYKNHLDIQTKTQVILTKKYASTNANFPMLQSQQVPCLILLAKRHRYALMCCKLNIYIIN